MEPNRPAVVKRREAVVRRYMLDHAMRPEDGRMLLAVSGGADSTALLLLLHRLSRSLKLRLHVAHFDHGLRGRSVAAREEAYVRHLCDSLSIPLFTGRGDVRETARRERLSPEDAARRDRYAFLARVATEAGCTAIATGHTASDQAETVLLHLIRGSGLAGLSGITPVSPWPFPQHEGLTLLRPLLLLSRPDTAAVCEAFGVTALEDESNASPRFRRNRIRHEVLPILRDINPGVDRALLRLAEASAETVDFLVNLARPLLESSSHPEGPVPIRPELNSERDGAARVPRTLASAPSALRHAAMRIALEGLASGPTDFTQRHYDALDRLLVHGSTGDGIDLPRDITAELDRDALVLSPAEASPEPLPEGPEELALGAYVYYGPYSVSVLTRPPASGAWAAVDASALLGGLVVRRRREGDRFQPLGMEGTKKLQDFFVDSRVPRAERDRVPIFESPQGIVWVGGLRIAEWAKPRPDSRTLFLCYEPVHN